MKYILRLLISISLFLIIFIKVVLFVSSKQNAIRAIEILEKNNFVGVIAVVDSDFDRLNKSMIKKDNLFYTDTHDIETMILKTSALNNFLNEFGSLEKINNINNARNILLEAGLIIGYLRWVSEKKKLFLKFKELEFRDFIDDETLDVDDEKFINAVFTNSNIQRPDLDDILNLIDDLKNDSHDPWQVCCGHDLINILEIGLKSFFGSKMIPPDTIERSLRLAYEYSFFKATMLYNEIMKWEGSNNQYKIFKND
ncbi:MAG: DUF4435 domain-containing protein [Nitrospirae bacterium]|nr:DUF4435 domain-containing protein [Nitrospirota bacterium]